MWGTHIAALAVLAAAVPSLAGTQCDANTPCPASAPCCSPFGFCNTGAFCLGGCNPLHSYTLTSCMPQPVCQSISTDFNDLSRVQVNGSQYDGNATAWDWIVERGHLEPDLRGNGARLTLTREGQGTLISSTRYVHYGEIDFEFQASKWDGVVSAAITMSDVEDEIDWEWTGDDITEVQSNYFFLGQVNYSDTNGGHHKLPSGDSSSEFHTYTLNWQQDVLQWKIDGTVVREVQKADTLSDDGQRYEYPTTPSRVQISIWAAGIDSSAPGTVEWAGGMIDWSDPDYATNGYFHNTLKSVRVVCADASHEASVTGYEFTGNDTNNIPMVGFTNRTTTLSSGGLLGTQAPPSGVLWLAATVALSLPLLSLAL